MSVAYVDQVDRRESTEVIRWSVSLLLVLVFHFVAALWLLSREVPVEANKPPPPAALLDLPPLPLPGAGTTPGAPPAKSIQPAPPKPVKPPVQEVKPVVPPPAPPKPAPVPKVVQPPQPAPVPKFAVPLPEAPKPLLPKPQPPKPQPVKPPQAATPEAPPSLTGSTPIVRLTPIGLWQKGVIERLEKFQIIPPEIKRGQEVPPVGLYIVVDRQGHILSYSIAVPSGMPSLDRAALAMARGAQWLPPLPAEIPGNPYSFTMMVRFY